MTGCSEGQTNYVNATFLDVRVFLLLQYILVKATIMNSKLLENETKEFKVDDEKLTHIIF